MRLAAVTLVWLLFACSATDENAGTNTPSGTSEAPAAGQNRSVPTAQQPTNGVAAPEPTGEISLQASPKQVSAGATVTLTLTNGSLREVGYNLCTSRLETSGGGSVPSDRVCTMELRILQPGGRTSYDYELPARLAPGGYRFRTGVDPMGAKLGLVVTSNSFEVR